MSSPARIRRHPPGVIVLHWLNALTWVAMAVTGTALIRSPHFRLLPPAASDWLADLAGGRAALLRLHVVWGLAWAVVIGNGVLIARGGLARLAAEFKLTGDDLRWLIRRPPRLFGIDIGPIPPQAKYNAGQKLFGLAALAGAALIVASGLAMILPGMPAAAVGWAVPIHLAAVVLVILGALVHFFMAALVIDERPALASMLTGYVDAEHAEKHSAKWVEEIMREPPRPHARPVASNSTGRETPLWNSYKAGFLLGLVLLASFVFLGRGLGASGAFSRELAFVLAKVAPAWTAANEPLGEYLAEPGGPLDNYLVAMGLGVFIGGLAAGLATRRIRVQVLRGPRISARGRLLLAFGGGALAGVGARLAHGCTSGQALSGGALLSAGGWLVMMSVFGAAFALAALVRREWM